MVHGARCMRVKYPCRSNVGPDVFGARKMLLKRIWAGLGCLSDSMRFRLSDSIDRKYIVVRELKS